MSHSQPTRFESTLVHAGFVLTGVVTTLLGPMLPRLSSQWLLTDAQAGRLFTAQFAGSILGTILISWLLPRRGYRLVLALGYLLMAAGIGGLALGIKVLGLPTVFVYGIGQGVAIAPSNLLVSNWHPQHRAAALNVLNFAWGIGAVVCPFFIGWAIRAGNLRGALLGLAVMLGIVALLAGLRFTSSPQSSGDSAPVTEKLRLWRNAFALAVGFMFFLYVGTETALGGWVASHAKRLDVDPSPDGQWVFAPSFFWGALLLGRAAAPFFLRRLSEKTLAVLDLLMATAGVMLLLEARSFAGVAAGATIAGFGCSSVFPINVALLSFFGPHSSRAAGPIFAAGNLGGAVIPWLVGWTATNSGSLRVALLVPLLAVLLLLALHTWNARRDRRDRKANLTGDDGD